MILIVDFGSQKTPLIAGQISDAGAACRIVNQQGFSSQKLHPANGIILSGSPVLFTDSGTARYLERFSWMKEITIPVLGICFGHQLLGILNGSQVYKGSEVRSSYSIRICRKDVLFSGIENPATMVEDHTEGITLPGQFIHLASSEYYPVEAMRHPVRPIWGVQFHPEVSRENGTRLFRNFLSQCQHC
jgi:GMP synthase (glutamine-hydrolysing)